MAESYRGLTIRIGGDTTSLNKALHTTNQAAVGTQSALRKLNSALKLDPTSVSAANMQVGAMAEQAANAATRMVRLNDAMRQIGEETTSFKGMSGTVKELVDGMGDVSAKASQARDYYSALTSTIATSYTNLTKLHKEAAKGAGDKFVKDMAESVKDMDFSKIIQGAKDVRSAFGDSKGRVKELISTVEALQKKHESLNSKANEYKKIMDDAEKNSEAFVMHGEADNKDYTLIKSMSKDFVEAASHLTEVHAEMDGVRESLVQTVATMSKYKGKGTIFSFDKKDVDLSSLKTGLDQIVAAEVITKEKAEELYAVFEKDKDMFKDAFAEVQAGNKLEGFRDLAAESEKARAYVKATVDEMQRLSDTSKVEKGLGSVNQKLMEIGKAASDAQQRMSAAASAISAREDKGFSANSGVQTAAIQAYSDALALAQMELEQFNQKVDAFASASDTVKQLAHSSESLYPELAKVRQQYEASATALKTYEGEMKALQQLNDTLKAKGGDRTDEEERQYAESNQKLEEMHAHLEELQSDFDGIASRKEDLVEALDMRKAEEGAAHALNNFEKIRDINMKPKVDVSAIDYLNKALDNISKGAFNAGMQQYLDNYNKKLGQTGAAVDAAKAKFEALNNLSKQSPLDKDVTSERLQAASQYAEKLQAHIDALKTKLNAIPKSKIDQVALSTNTVSEAFTKAKQRVEDVEKEIQVTEQRLKNLKDEKGSLVTTGDSEAKIAALNKRIEELRQKIVQLKAKRDDALIQLDTEQATQEVEQLTNDINKYEAAKRALEDGVTPKIDDAAFMQAVDRVSQAARRMASEVVQSANEIDSAYRDMRKTVNGTEEEYEALKDSAIEFSQTHVTSTDTMLEMQALGGQLGILTEDLRQFGEIGSNLDIATDMNAEDIALKLGQISNVLHLDIDGIQGFADALVRLGNNMPAQESAIMAVAQRFGAVASTASFSGDEILAWSAAIASTGQRSEAAATAIGNTVSGIEQAIANGGNDLKQFAAIAGMSADEFVSTWKSSPTEALKSFINGLQTLVDSDESAVAALENMGITGVRQQQTLLGLSQTIDSLDKALEISGNAWNQISDDWGDAGDAANEAEKKAAGFSGALAILKNNAQNLAAVFGDSLVEPMKIAAEAIRLITDTLSAMPPFVRNIVVGLGAASVAFSTITPVLRIFNSGIADLLVKLAGSATFGEFTAKLLGLEGAFVATNTAGGGLLTTIGGLAAKIGPVALVVAAAATAFAVTYSAIDEYCKRQELLRMSTEGMVEAINSAQAAYDGYAPSIHDAMSSLEELRAKNEEITQSQAALAEEMGKKWEEFGVNAAMVDSYAEAISRLSDAGELTTSQQAELVAAVKAFNEITGSNIEILDQQNGKLSESDSYIKNLAESWKSLAESEAAYEMYKDVVKQRIEDELALADATNSLEEAQSAAQTVQGSWFNDMRDGASASNAAANGVAAYQKEVDEAQKKVDSAKETEEQYLKIMNDSYSVFGQMRTALVEAGESTEEFDKLTKEQLAQIAAEYDGTAASVIEAIRRIKAATDEAGSILGELESSSDKAVKSAYDTAKAQFDAAYQTLKSDLDQKYKEAQRAFDNEYKLQQRAYDAIYKAQQKAYDSEYKAAQKAYDAEYKQRQKEYDKQYKALQKKLDSEYKARKSAYDKELKALKDANDDEVEAFKKATDAKLKEMEREYKAKLKLLELEYGQKDSDIDDQIETLEAETKAEKQAIEERKQQEKIAELEREVTRANSRRRRAEAEKALNDYIQQVEQERNEESRKAEIERLKEQQSVLKDELAERKEALKESYEAEVEAYKEKRENELDALKEANDLEYDARKEYYDTQLELLKENQQAQLEAAKENQQAALESLKENQQAQLESLKESQTAQLEALKQSQQDSLESLKASQQAELESMKAAHQKQLDDLKATQDAMLQEIKESGVSMQRESNLIGAGIGAGLSGGMKPGMRDARESVINLHDTIDEKMTNLVDNAWPWGDHLGNNLYSGLSGWETPLSNLAGSIAGGIALFLQHSTPKRGPLRNDDVWGEHLVQNIVDGMRSKEGELYRQVENMARAVEEGFDPTLTVDAAYEALDAISKNGRSLTIEAAKASAPVITIDMTLNVSDFSIRNDSDIDRLSDQISQKMAAAAARELAGRLG